MKKEKKDEMKGVSRHRKVELRHKRAKRVKGKKMRKKKIGSNGKRKKTGMRKFRTSSQKTAI